MSSNKFQKFCCVLAIHFAVAQSQPQDGFYNFLSNAMQDFPNWIIQKGLDPTPVIPYMVNFSSNSPLLNMSGSISDHTFTRISDNRVVSIDSNMLEMRFSIMLQWGYLIDNSTCHVEGTVMTTIPISGDGPCLWEENKPEQDIQSDNRKQTEIKTVSELSVNNLGITPEGYFDMSVADITSYYYGFVPSYTTLSFDVISAGGYEANVLDLMKNAYYVDVQYFFPSFEYLQTYLEELFEVTPVSEIIGTTARPPSTPSTSTSTTTESDATSTNPTHPTSTPNPCLTNENNQETIIHNETILDTRVVKGDNGKIIKITRKLLEVSIMEDMNDII